MPRDECSSNMFGKKHEDYRSQNINNNYGQTMAKVVSEVFVQHVGPGQPTSEVRPKNGLGLRDTKRDSGNGRH